jgi:L-fuculose-phosphate aldolase
MSAGGPSMTNVMYEALFTAASTTTTTTTTTTKNKNHVDMLDIGFGIGGAAFDFYSKITATGMTCTIHGIDLGQQGWELAQAELDRRNQQRQLEGMAPLTISFRVLDAVEADFPAESFDIIYSRDTFVHFSASLKHQVLTKCYTWLKPAGQLCIADYCLGTNVDSISGETKNPSFATYLQARNYHMYTPSRYAKAAEAVGFANGVEARDMAYWYCTTCQTELDRVALDGPGRDSLLQTQGLEQVSKLEQTYRDKIQMTLRGDRSYVLVLATKMAANATSTTTAAVVVSTPEPEEHNRPHMALRQELVDAYQKLYETGSIMSCDGNLSARADEKHILVTPTAITVDQMKAHQVVLCDSNGKSLELYKPTSEIDLHTLIYQSRPDVGAIVHSHSIYACALASCRMALPPTHYAVCELICCDTKKKGHTDADAANAMVKCSTYHTYGTYDLANACLMALGKNYACFLANHGSVVVGTDLAHAMYLNERLERECEIFWRAKQLGPLAPPVALTLDEIKSLALRDETYGQDATEEGVAAEEVVV